VGAEQADLKALAFLHAARERDDASGSALTKMELVEFRSYSPPANVPTAVMDSNRILFARPLV
jgi:hypothetical protein